MVENVKVTDISSADVAATMLPSEGSEYETRCHYSTRAVCSGAAVGGSSDDVLAVPITPVFVSGCDLVVVLFGIPRPSPAVGGAVLISSAVALFAEFVLALATRSRGHMPFSNMPIWTWLASDVASKARSLGFFSGHVEIIPCPV